MAAPPLAKASVPPNLGRLAPMHSTWALNLPIPSNSDGGPSQPTTPRGTGGLASGSTNSSTTSTVLAKDVAALSVSGKVSGQPLLAPLPSPSVWTLDPAVASLDDAFDDALQGDALEALITAMQPAAPATPAVRIAVMGPPGSGRGTLAIMAAERTRERFESGWLLDGSSEAALLCGLQRIAHDLALPVKKPEDVVNAVHQALSCANSRPWLLIVRHLPTQAVEDRVVSLVPSAGGCIVVTCEPSVQALGATTSVGLFEMAEWTVISVPHPAPTALAEWLVHPSPNNPSPTRQRTELAASETDAVLRTPPSLDAAREAAAAVASLLDSSLLALMVARRHVSRCGLSWPEYHRRLVAHLGQVASPLPPSTSVEAPCTVSTSLLVPTTLASAGVPASDAAAGALADPSAERHTDVALSLMLADVMEQVPEIRPLLQMLQLGHPGEIDPQLVEMAALQALAGAPATEEADGVDGGGDGLGPSASSTTLLRAPRTKTRDSTRTSSRRSSPNLSPTLPALAMPGDRRPVAALASSAPEVALTRSRVHVALLVLRACGVTMPASEGTLAVHPLMQPKLARILPPSPAAALAMVQALTDATDERGTPSLVLLQTAALHFSRVVAWLDEHHPNSPELIAALRACAQLLQHGVHQLVQAQALYARVVRLCERLYGDQHARVAVALARLGGTYGDTGEYADQLALLERALAIRERRFGPEHVQVAGTLVAMAGVYRCMGEECKRRQQLEQALAVAPPSDAKAASAAPVAVAPASEPNLTAIDVAALVPPVPLLQSAPGTMAGSSDASTAVADAAAAADLDHADVNSAPLTLNDADTAAAAAAAAAAAPPAAPAAVLVAAVAVESAAQPTYESVEECWRKQKELLERALPIMTGAYASGHPEVARVMTNLGTTYYNLGELEQARAILTLALEAKERAFGSDHVQVALTAYNLGLAELALKHPEEAETALQRALRIYTARNGSNHPTTVTTQSALNALAAQRAKCSVM